MSTCICVLYKSPDPPKNGVNRTITSTIFVTLDKKTKHLFQIYFLESRGFAFVRFYSKRDAGDAIDAIDGRDVDGRLVF